MQAIKINAEHTESVRKDLLRGKCWQQSESACYFSDIMLSKFSFFSVNVYLLLFSVHEREMAPASTQLGLILLVPGSFQSCSRMCPCRAAKKLRQWTRIPGLLQVVVTVDEE